VKKYTDIPIETRIQMSTVFLTSVGALVGGLAGAGIGFKASKKMPKGKKTQAKTPAKQKTPELSVQTSPARSPKGKFEVFGAKTRYFNQNHDFFTLMKRLENYLQFKEEREAYTRVAEHIDNLLGMENLLNAREPISKSSLPTVAQSARNSALRLLTDIVKFSDKQRPSPTKRETMTTIVEEIQAAMDDVILDMQKVLAAKPVVV